jgi:hypothetical protein
MALALLAGMALSMKTDPSMKRTAVCSDMPHFSLVDFQKGEHYHKKHGIKLGADVHIVGLYYAD